jgi:signal transduction histidine kinase
MFYGWSDSPFSEEEIKILHRFKSIIDLTFRRYMELKKSETNAVDAIRRASLDRVRAETASMRTTSDLEKITPMIWNELSTLGVPFIRCGVFIMDEAQELIHTFLSTPDGKAIASFHLPYKASADLWETVTHWRKKELYQQHWDETAFAEWTENLMQQGFITSSDTYATEHRPTNLYLHFLPFMQGMLYVGNDAALNESDLQLVQNLADAFSTAYARYEDFNRLEVAKEQVDKTLTDLKQAQSQLVQAEKMASLGELTAGIAHEIQNPLNFVNNFSEINTELSDEIVEAAKKGDLQEIMHLAADIKSNQGKISEHGKRADAIVKGMLQHSRSSSGVKEPTDINKLADEYFRLAYHGLRAKDKTFNAALHTDFDPTIGKIPIMPQDIGRVLLNLYNNAFYVVSEKQKLSIEGYEPMVSLRTKKINGEVEICVADNGSGIPEKVLDKVFQPFFTTKPTGQGTGLGLSLSYDIIKAHQGTINIRNTPGDGVEFIITLPINA